MAMLNRALIALLFAALAAKVGALPRIETFDLGGQCVGMVDLAVAIEGGILATVPNPSQSADANVALSYTNLITTLEFYEQVLGVDTAGLYPRLSLATHFSDAAEECSTGNAFFNAQLAMLGVLKGSPENSLLVAADLDVLGHEFTHGVVSETIGLQGDCDADGRNEAGALEESIADMVGITLRLWQGAGRRFPTNPDDGDFDVGRNVGPLNDLRVVRAAANPAEMGNTDYYADWDTPCDGPHRNSTVSTLAYRLLVSGGEHPDGKSDVEVQGIGLEPAIRLVYYVLHHRLVSARATIPDFAEAMALAARKLHGADSTQYRSVLDAFSAVGVDMAPLYPPGSEAPVVRATARIPVGGSVLLAVLFAITVLPFFVLRRITDRQPALAQPPRPPSPVPQVGAPRPAGDSAGSFSNVVVVTPGGERIALALGSKPVILGREGGGIPETLRQVLARDPSLSRQHCEMWFNPERNAVYFRNLSPNSTTINGHLLNVGEKGAASLSTHAHVVMGRMELLLELGKSDDER